MHRKLYSELHELDVPLSNIFVVVPVPVFEPNSPNNKAKLEEKLEHVAPEFGEPFGERPV